MTDGTAGSRDAAVVDALVGVSTGVVGDALLRLGLFSHCAGIRPVHANDIQMVGRAFTVLYRSQSKVRPGTVGDYIDDVGAGQVVVLDNRGRTDCTVWGDILTLVAHERGAAGTVIDGVCRDTARADSLGYALYAHATTMRTGKGQVEVASVGEPVSLGQAHVAPGDLIVADRDGVCVVPWDRVSEVIEAVHLIRKAEEVIESLVRGGSTLAEARSQTGYFRLQDPEESA
jgi:4-hydroxy-4-methyl-2-oxoglutarate aldolase